MTTHTITFWDLLNDRLNQTDDELVPVAEPNVAAAIYPKKERPRKTVNPFDLPKLPTRTLLRYLHVARINGTYSPFGHDGGGGISFERIKVELAKRPHIPKGNEAKAFRRAKAMKHRGRPRPRILLQDK